MNDKKRVIWGFTSALGRIIILGLALLFIANIARSIYKNYQTKQQIDTLENEISQLQNEKVNLENRILYYETDTYKEIETRKHLGYRKPDEKVAILIQNEGNTTNLQIENNSQDQIDDTEDNTPNWQKWYQFIFS